MGLSVDSECTVVHCNAILKPDERGYTQRNDKFDERTAKEHLIRWPICWS